MWLVWHWTVAARTEGKLQKFQAVQHAIAEGFRRKIRRSAQLSHLYARAFDLRYDSVSILHTLVGAVVADDIDIEIGLQLACPLEVE